MSRVADILLSKSAHTVVTVSPDATVYDAVRLMAEHGIGALPVTEGERLVGIVSERDYARKMVLQGRASRETAVREIMTAQVRCVSPEHSAEQCMALMTEHRLRHLPVLAHDKLIGLVSIGDLVKDIIAQQQFVISQLESYIAGGPGH